MPFQHRADRLAEQAQLGEFLAVRFGRKEPATVGGAADETARNQHGDGGFHGIRQRLWRQSQEQLGT